MRKSMNGAVKNHNINERSFDLLQYLIEATYVAVIKQLDEFCGIGSGSIVGTISQTLPKKKRKKLNKQRKKADNFL